MGWNWAMTSLPYMGTTGLSGAALALYSNLYNLRFFSRIPGSNEYLSQFGDLAKLVLVPSESQLRLTEPDGTVFVFHAMDVPGRPGGFVSMTTPGGVMLEVTAESGNRVLELQRSLTDGATTITDSFQFTYVDSGPLSGHMTACAHRRQVNSDPWKNVTRCVYSFYDGSDDYGSLADLRTATRQVWTVSETSSSSSGGGGVWADVGTDYYRYYKAGDSHGSAHDLRFVCLPEAFAKLSEAAGDPFTASDSLVALYADNYYEYDGIDRCVLERVYAGSKTITYAYERNPRYVSESSSSSSSVAVRDFNIWVFKTTETQPDGSRRIVYANYAGQTMLLVLRSENSGSSSSSTPGQWCTFFRYDDRGRKRLSANPSAVIGFDENLDDLLGYDAEDDRFVYLKDDEGFIQLFEYYGPSSTSSSSSTPTPEPDGYLKAERIQNGQAATPILLRTLEYTYHTVGDTTVFPISEETQYSDGTFVFNPIATSYAYTFYTGTTQVKQRTTMLPIVSIGENGSGVANTRKDYFDEVGYRTWSMDERGFITRYVYDRVTGALIQRIDDVDTSITTGEPSGWTTPSGGGLNLITDFESDDQGRIVQELGPSHSVDVSGTATTVRTATWTVYDDSAHTTRVARGYATGTGPSYTYSLVNPVQIEIRDKSERPLEAVSATRESPVGKLQPSDTFPQSSYIRWRTSQYTDCCILASERFYHAIPESGVGTSGANFDQIDFGYDVMKRRNKVVTPGGTIVYDLMDCRDLLYSTYIGTNDVGGTSVDPTGGGAFENNMVLVTRNEYDNGLFGGDGNLTQVSQWVDTTTVRQTEMAYDWRNRLTTIDGEIDFYERRSYDNLNRVRRIDRFDTSTSGNLIGRTETNFDSLSRVYEAIRYAVDLATGTIGFGLSDQTWHDPSGNVAMTLPSGSSVHTKTTYDGLNRPVVVYVGYTTEAITYSSIFTVVDDVVLEQTETEYDDAGNAIQATRRERYHNDDAAETGALQTPSLDPKARVTYAASYPDVVNRLRATADYGTNGGASFTRSAIIPARSNTVLVFSQAYNEASSLLETVDPAGMAVRFGYDDAGRRIQVVENFVSPPPSSSSSGGGCSPSTDTNRTTNVTYSPDGKVATLEAVNSATGNQVTQYLYGTTLDDSNISASVLLRSVVYPDAADPADRVALTYNRQAQRTSLTDQNGTVHEYIYDLLGRITHDRVTTLAEGIDDAVLRLGTTYEVRGLVSTLTSYDNPIVGAGQAVDQVQFTYNSFGQSIKTYQAHDGLVDALTTPWVGMEYANGSQNTIRQTGLTYPNGRELAYIYGGANTINLRASRVAEIRDVDSHTTLAQYEYLGRATVVQQTSPEPDLRYTLINPTGTNDPATGDIYSGLDLFGRVKDVRWMNVTSGVELSRIQYGYDRASSRIWRENPTDPDRHFDWKYDYDGLHRLKDGQRGTLNGTHTAITDPQFGQCWTLDATGNWQGFKQSDDGYGWTLEQARSASAFNEITGIESPIGPQWATPAYDQNGNMTTVPRAEPTPPSWSNLTVNQWDALTVDEWACMETALTFHATYDAWNRLVKLVHGGNELPAQENRYDGRRYRIVTKIYEGGTLTEARHTYYTDQWQAIEETLEDSPAPDRQFSWGIRYIDDLIVRIRSISEGTLNEHLYAMQDANWNVIAIANSDGVIQERYDYSPYGKCVYLYANFTVSAESASDWDILYSGYRIDSGIGIYHVRCRSYHSSLGVWTTRDPRRLRLLENMYEYGSLRPCDVGDPYGLEPIGTTQSVEDWFAQYRRTHPGQSDRWYQDELEHLKNSGCVGIATLLLGYRTMATDDGKPDPANMRNCYLTLNRARVEQQRQDADGDCTGKNCYREAASARIVAITLRYGNGSEPIPTYPDTDKADLRNWSGRGATDADIPFDYGFYDDSTGMFLHANQADQSAIGGPAMRVYTSNEERFRDLGLSPRNLNNVVYCVMCENFTRGTIGLYGGQTWCTRPNPDTTTIGGGSSRGGGATGSF